MTPVIAALVILTWLGFGYIGGAINYAHFTLQYPMLASSENRSADCLDSFFVTLFGPLALLAVLLSCKAKHGICWNWITKPALVADNFTSPTSALGSPASVGYRTYIFGTSALVSNGKPKPDFSSLPRVETTEPITAYRVWKLNADGRLCSAYKDHIIWPPRKRLETDDFENAGIHAVKDIHRLAGRVLRNSVSEYQTTEGLWQEYHADVAGEVYLWGTVKEHELGYTAQYAYPKQLWMPEDSDPLTVMQLEEHYGVPVILRKEFVKPVQEVMDDYQTYMARPKGGWIGSVSYSPGQIIPVNPVYMPQFYSVRPCQICGYLSPNPSGLCSSCELNIATMKAQMNSVTPTATAAQQANAYMGTAAIDAILTEAFKDQKLLLPPAPAAPDPTNPDPAAP
jgi:hypothetical protein